MIGENQTLDFWKLTFWPEAEQKQSKVFEIEVQFLVLALATSSMSSANKTWMQLCNEKQKMSPQ